MDVTKTLITAEQFLEMNLSDVRAELVEGEVIEMSPPGAYHGVVCIKMSSKLESFVSTHSAGVVLSEIGFVLRRNPDLVRAPDIAFISQERVGAQGLTEKFWPGPPDLAVEVLSPDDRLSEVLRKVGEYLEAGGRLVWVVNSKNRTISAYRGLDQVRVYTADEELSGEDVLPGFRLKVAEIFP